MDRVLRCYCTFRFLGEVDLKAGLDFLQKHACLPCLASSSLHCLLYLGTVSGEG